jgi:rRNA-processing protein FCF1
MEKAPGSGNIPGRSKTILLDTTSLVSAYRYKVDINAELQRICNFPYTLAIIDKTRDELSKIKALVALQMLPDVAEIKTEGSYVDDLILSIITPEGHAVATQDQELKRRIKEKHVPIISIRQKSHLQLER